MYVQANVLRQFWPINSPVTLGLAATTQAETCATQLGRAFLIRRY